MSDIKRVRDRTLLKVVRNVLRPFARPLRAGPLSGIFVVEHQDQRFAVWPHYQPDGETYYFKLDGDRVKQVKASDWPALLAAHGVAAVDVTYAGSDVHELRS